MAVSTKPKTTGDVILHYESPQANLFSVDVVGAALVTNNVPQVAGYPVVVAAGSATLLKTTEMATATHLLFSGPPIVDLAADATAPGKYTAIGISETGAGGNILANSTCLPTTTQATDCGGTAWAAADADGIALRAALGALGFRFQAEPANQSTQTT